MKLFSEFIRRPGDSLWADAVWQLPRPLFAERQSQQLTESEFLFIAISGHSDGEFVLRHVASQRAMKLVPPTEDGPPVRVRFPLHDRMMDAVHARRDDDHVQNTFEADWQPPVGMMK